MMPLEYDEWVNAHYERLAAVAKTRAGTQTSMDAYELVDTAVMRALASTTFPHNDESRWWSWHCGAIRSAVSNSLVAGLRGRANAAQESAAAILSEAQSKRTRRLRLQVHPHTIRRKYPKPRWPHATFIYVRTYLDACTCGYPVRWRLDRDEGGDWVSSLECWNGHHIKQEGSMPFVERKSQNTGGAFFKWDVVGKEFTGQYVRLGKGSYKGRDTYHAVFIQQGTGAEVKVNAPTVLKRRLEEEFKPGTTLYIKYTHDERGNNPQPSKIFAIFEWEADQAAPAAVPTAQPPATAIPLPQAAPAVPTPPASLAPAPAAIPLPAAPVIPAAPAASEYQTLLGKLQAAAGPSYALMVKMLDSYTTEQAKVEALKLTLRNTFGLAI